MSGGYTYKLPYAEGILCSLQALRVQPAKRASKAVRVSGSLWARKLAEGIWILLERLTHRGSFINLALIVSDVAVGAGT